MSTDLFGKLSGLETNTEKSNLFFSKKARPNSEQLQQVVGFSMGNLPVRYLGVPLITSTNLLIVSHYLIMWIKESDLGRISHYLMRDMFN